MTALNQAESPYNDRVEADIGEARKQFFFAKKNQKTFVPLVYVSVATSRIETSKSFLVLFSKKNCSLPF
jgi:hypothetical protein